MRACSAASLRLKERSVRVGRVAYADLPEGDVLGALLLQRFRQPAVLLAQTLIRRWMQIRQG